MLSNNSPSHQTDDSAKTVTSNVTKLRNLDSEMTNLVTELKSGLQPQKLPMLSLSDNNTDDVMLDFLDDLCATSYNIDSADTTIHPNDEPVSTTCDKVEEDSKKIKENGASNVLEECVRKPLSEIIVDINSIMPHETLAPRTILDEKQGLKITLNFTRDRPRDDVDVLVITTTNHNSQSLSNYQFDASVSRVS